MQSKQFLVVISMLLSVWILGVSAESTLDVGAIASTAMEACSPNLDPPEEPGLRPPTNIRIIREDLEDSFSDSVAEWTPGPSVWPEEAEGTSLAGVAAAPHEYFNMLTARADCLTSFHFRSQANIDLTRSRADNDSKIPIKYDPEADAALFAIDPSGSLPHSGATTTPQKRLPIGIQGVTSMLLTWDFKIDESMRWRPGSEPRLVKDRMVDVTYLGQHKSHRLDTRDAEPWVGVKHNFAKATNKGRGVAEVFFNARAQWMGPGTERGDSEMITPVLSDFYAEPGIWTRAWIFVEGNIGVGDNAVRLSVWLADENRGPVRLYNRVNMIAPASGMGLFRFEFDSSQKQALNGPGRQYQRNWVVLKGLSEAQVVALLQKPAN